MHQEFADNLKNINILIEKINPDQDIEKLINSKKPQKDDDKKHDDHDNDDDDNDNDMDSFQHATIKEMNQYDDGDESLQNQNYNQWIKQSRIHSISRLIISIIILVKLYI